MNQPFDLQQLAQQQAQKEMATHVFVTNTAIHIYAILLSQHIELTPTAARECAQQAKEMAPYLGEAFGLIKMTDKS